MTSFRLRKRLLWRLMKAFCELCYFVEQRVGSALFLRLYYKASNTCCAIGWDLYGHPSSRDHNNVWELWT